MLFVDGLANLAVLVAKTVVGIATGSSAVLAAVVQSVPGVRGTRSVRSHLSGQGVRIDVVVAVDPRLSTAASHDIADEIERTLRERFATPDVTVHVEPED